MRRLLVVIFLFCTSAAAQIEPNSWWQFWGWLNSLNSGDAAKHAEFLKQHSVYRAQLSHPFLKESAAEMELFDRAGGGLTLYRSLELSDTEMHVILKGRNGQTWADAVVQVASEAPYLITKVGLYQIPAPQSRQPECPATETGTTTAAKTAPPAKLIAPKLLSPEEGAVFADYPRVTTVRWTAVPGAAGYWVEWDYKEQAGWASEVETAHQQHFEALETSYTFKFVGAQTGRWRVCAFDESGAPGAMSEWREFRYTR